MTAARSKQVVYSTNEVCALAEVTPRQLQWWAERRVLVPDSSTGRNRRYGAHQVAQARFIRALYRTLLPDRLRRALGAAPPKARYLLIAGGRKVSWHNDAAGVVAAALEAASGVVVLDLAQCVGSEL
jgi:CubicO group peptidase (beta-lactamase class C family)